MFDKGRACQSLNNNRQQDYYVNIYAIGNINSFNLFFSIAMIAMIKTKLAALLLVLITIMKPS